MKKDGLTAIQLKEYNEKDYLGSIDILSSETVKEIKSNVSENKI